MARLVATVDTRRTAMRRLHAWARRRRLAAVSAVAVLAVAASSAQATFPGENGRITFSSDRLGHFEIYSALPGGGDVRRLTHSGEANSVVSDWSPDGRWIVFDSDRAADVQVFIMRADGTRERQLTFRPGFTANPAFAPDGRRIVFQHARPDQPSDLYIMNLRSGEWQRVTRTPNVFEFTPQFSPDGRWIAYTQFREQQAPAVYLIRPDGSDRHRLTPLRLRAGVPDWRPDGKRIVITSNVDVPNSDIYTIQPNGHGLRQLTHGPADEDDGTYSPRGGRIVFTRFPARGDNADIWMIHGDGTRLRPVITSPALDLAPDWGPLPR
jgi:Tol biopolymer transport system component